MGVGTSGLSILTSLDTTKFLSLELATGMTSFSLTAKTIDPFLAGLQIPKSGMIRSFPGYGFVIVVKSAAAKLQR